MGGGTSIVAGVHRDPPGTRRLDAIAQAEVGLRLASESLYFRLDLDMQATSAPLGLPAFGLPAFVYPEWSLPAQELKIGPPEWAMLQIGREDYHLRLGIVSHAIGIEDWDSWTNYFPTFSTMISTVPGRMLGVEPGLVLGEGYEINVFGGFDLDVDAPTFGAGLTTMQALWSTWSGVAFYPTIDFYSAVVALELYPAEALSVSIDGSVGLVGAADEAGAIELKPWVGGEVIANILPSMPIHPLVRVQALHEHEGALSAFLFAPQPSVSASAGLTFTPFDELKISLEGKASKVGDDILPGLFALVALRRPEPPPYAAK
ncbi:MULTISPECIES: hypothetical protein [Sorangium]|uniref:Uncharacterized protein n=1 Tax=Sorangium cellulosum TaxID=56 RepID=A0A4P2R6P9_SORCE|nr:MULTISPECIES: hypothetical protein [Sorangium]AUX38401.1 hypothetical protein SOCE836_106450 [Sorangium cellulosum]WCQ97689.1 hypothetical protein NQZ70_10485 [Sorangium sp. Soce836]